MYKFSKRSQERLDTCDKRLQAILSEAIKEMDFTILEGNRSVQRQQELFQQGRSQLDGVNKKSKHNYSPSLAVDIAPYTIDWNDYDRFKALAKIVKRIAKEKGIKIVWGGDWKSFIDMPHYQL